MPPNNTSPVPSPRIPLTPFKSQGKIKHWLFLAIGAIIIMIMILIAYHALTSSQGQGTQPSTTPLATLLPSPSVTPSESPLPSTSPSPSPTPTPASIEIRNGTHIAGLAQRLKDKLTKEKFTVTAIGNAANRSVTKTTVYDLTVADADTAQQLASELSANAASTPPKGEAKSNADILIILGTDAASIKP